MHALRLPDALAAAGPPPGRDIRQLEDPGGRAPGLPQKREERAFDRKGKGVAWASPTQSQRYHLGIFLPGRTDRQGPMDRLVAWQPTRQGQGPDLEVDEACHLGAAT